MSIDIFLILLKVADNTFNKTLYADLQYILSRYHVFFILYKTSITFFGSLI